MDTVTTIIVTVLGNAVVTGVIVFLFQKRTENSFARKLEEFKAHLAYSNFEQQQRFSAMHPKRVETLEILYKKYYDFFEVFGEWTDSVRADRL